MKTIRLFLSLLLTFPCFAQESDSSSGDIETLTEYLTNLGTYLGFDITKPKHTEGSEEAVEPQETLLDIDATLLAQQYAFATLLGATPVNAFDEAVKLFVPTDTPDYAKINDAANYTFQTQGGDLAYASPSTGDQGKVSVSVLMDQETYQDDPTNQAILNILSTPNYTYCMNNDQSAWVTDCELLHEKQVPANVVGTTLPNTHEFYTYDYNEPLIPQLNANTLLAPLMYTTSHTENTTSSSGSSNTTSSSAEQGLTASNQVQQALNFIRYISNSVTPIPLSSLKHYDEVYLKATNTDGSVTELDRIDAQYTLATYLSKLRTYAASQSIPISNFYYLLSNRMPQKSQDGKTQSSKALSDFEMATRRLYDPKKESGKQWIDEINQASTATVQKEMVILLSELNYQLYLLNQKHDRLLLTESMLLMATTHSQYPEMESSTPAEETSTVTE